ncbi:MAG TPA: polysaccharide deacetylase family protein [Thermomicrobiales bacterium]
MTATPIPQTNALLGYLPDARLLIINADDFGMCHASNVATVAAWQSGIVTSATLMTPCPWAPHALRLLGEHPDFPFGVHLTLICEHRDYRWGPVAAKSAVPSLLDGAGFFYRLDRREELLARAQLDEVEIEFRAQINTALAANLRPTHLDWHCLADGGRPDIFDLTLRLAQEYGLVLRVHYRPAAAQCHRVSLPTADFDVLDSYSLPTADKPARYAALLRALPPGLSEWAVHPSLGDAEARAMEPDGWPVRRADYDFMVSPEARAIVEEEGIVLLDFRALQRVVNG